MADEAKAMAVMVKPVGSRCNMQCRYCYYLDKGQYSTHAKQTRMNFDLLERLIRETIETTETPVISFVWHGGEPTLAGLDFFEKAVALQRKYLPRGRQVWNNLQTNGLLLNDAWCRFLKENRFDVGLSIDGSQTFHDANRTDRGGHATYERVSRAVERLQKVGIRPDLLCTVNAVNAKAPLETYRALRDMNTGWIQFIPIVIRLADGTMAPESVSPEAYGQFLCAVFDEWLLNDLGKTDVQLFAETAKIWAGGTAAVCTMAPECGQVLIAEEDGGIYACDHFVDSAHRWGTIGKDKLAELAFGEEQTAFGKQKAEVTAQCRACPYLNLCRGGCLKDRFAQTKDGEPGLYYLCEGLRTFFAHADAPLHRVMELSARGMKPAEIMAEMKNRA